MGASPRFDDNNPPFGGASRAERGSWLGSDRCSCYLFFQAPGGPVSLRGELACLGRAPPVEGWIYTTSPTGEWCKFSFFLCLNEGVVEVGASEFQEHCTEAERPSVTVFLELFGVFERYNSPSFFYRRPPPVNSDRADERLNPDPINSIGSSGRGGAIRVHG